MNPSLFVPLVDNAKLPQKVRDFFRFGVPVIPQNSENWTLSQQKGKKYEKGRKTVTTPGQIENTCVSDVGSLLL